MNLNNFQTVNVSSPILLPCLPLHPSPYAWVHLHFYLPQLTASQVTQTQKYSKEKNVRAALTSFISLRLLWFIWLMSYWRALLTQHHFSILNANAIFIATYKPRIRTRLRGNIWKMNQYSLGMAQHPHVGNSKVERGSALLIGGWRLRLTNSAPNWVASVVKQVFPMKWMPFLIEASTIRWTPQIGLGLFALTSKTGRTLYGYKVREMVEKCTCIKIFWVIEHACHFMRSVRMVHARLSWSVKWST